MLKRPEVRIILLLLILIASWIIGTTDRKRSLDSILPPSDAPFSAAIKALHAERDYGNLRLDITLQARNQGLHPITLIPPDATLQTLDGRAIPPFLLPSSPQPKLEPGSNSQLKLSYWLEATDLDETLQLHLPDLILPVLSARSIQLDTLTNATLSPLPLPPASAP